MRVRVTEVKRPISAARDTWFRNRLGEEFHVLGVYETNQRLYRVDVAHLAARGEIDVKDAFLPSDFAEIVEDRFRAA